MNFDSLDALIQAIRKDIADAEQLLEENSEWQKLKISEFFTKKSGLITNSCSDESLKSSNSQLGATNGHS